MLSFPHRHHALQRMDKVLIIITTLSLDAAVIVNDDGKVSFRCHLEINKIMILWSNFLSYLHTDNNFFLILRRRGWLDVTQSSTFALSHKKTISWHFKISLLNYKEMKSSKGIAKHSNNLSLDSLKDLKADRKSNKNLELKAKRYDGKKAIKKF